MENTRSRSKSARTSMSAMETRENILDAATRVVNRIGFSKATIDAIAQEAEMSKGGVLYHFKTRDACLLAILERVFERILTDAQAFHEAMPHGPGSMLKAYIRAWISWQMPPRHVQIKGLLENDALRERLIDLRIGHYCLVLDGAIPERIVQKVLLICAGLWTTPLLARASTEELAVFFTQMRDEMLEMIDDALTESSRNET